MVGAATLTVRLPTFPTEHSSQSGLLFLSCRSAEIDLLGLCLQIEQLLYQPTHAADERVEFLLVDVLLGLPLGLLAVMALHFVLDAQNLAHEEGCVKTCKAHQTGDDTFALGEVKVTSEKKDFAS